MKKYKLISDNKPYNKYISSNGLIDYYNIDKDNIATNYPKYMKAIKSNPKYLKVYNDIVSNMTDILNKEKQKGGANLPAILIAVPISVLVPSVIGYFVYRWYIGPTCKSEYTLYDVNKIPTLVGIFKLIIPTDSPLIPTIKEEELTTETINKFAIDLKANLEQIRTVLSVISPETEVGQAIVDVVRVASSVGAIVASYGAGGDTIINLIFIMRDVASVLVNILSVLSDFASEKRVLRIIYDLFNINFEYGPYGVKCQVNYIMKKYGKETVVITRVCEIFRKLLDKLASFVGSSISLMLPNTAGVVAVVVKKIVQLASKGFVAVVIWQMEDLYSYIPYDKQILLQEPEKFNIYLQRNIALIENVLKIKHDTEDVKKTSNIIKDNTDFFANAISKLFTLQFVVLHVLSNCKL